MCLCSNMDWNDWLTLCLSFIAIVVAVFIPEKIKWEQTYSSLVAEYRSYDFAIAYQSIIEFFVEECKCNMDEVQKKYEDHYIKENHKCVGVSCNDSDKSLHFQRRYLAQFFWQLDLCSKSVFIGKHRITNDFSSSEAKMVKILYYMDMAIDSSEILYKDISAPDIVPSPEHSKGMNKYLSHIYKILNKSKRWMQ